jgi:hypothetical protein
MLSIDTMTHMGVVTTSPLGQAGFAAPAKRMVAAAVARAEDTMENVTTAQVSGQRRVSMGTGLGATALLLDEEQETLLTLEEQLRVELGAVGERMDAPGTPLEEYSLDDLAAYAVGEPERWEARVPLWNPEAGSPFFGLPMEPAAEVYSAAPESPPATYSPSSPTYEPATPPDVYSPSSPSYEPWSEYVVRPVRERH